MAKALLIANPIAARHNSRTPSRVAEQLAMAGWGLDIAVTNGPADARRFAQEGLDAGVDVIAVYGGDGTTMQAVAAIVGTDTPLALIPGGTGNLLAGNLRIPANPVRAAAILMHGKRRRLDLGRVVLPDGEHYFGVACGAGVDAQVMGRTATADKRRWGIGAYWASTFRVLPGLKSTDCRITVDGEVLELRAALILIMNCGEMIPPVIRIRPEISPDDGLLDMVTVTADSAYQGMRGLLRAVLHGRREQIPDVPYLRYARGRKFTVEPADPLPVQFDGDPVGTTPFTAEVIPKSLTVLTP